ncbi:MAG TPA: hypothetical protein VKA89_08390 [Solirubrobacterales bacterium]|nr:hypothetical protein [Solirubrobacterales bacterium]
MRRASTAVAAALVCLLLAGLVPQAGGASRSTATIGVGFVTKNGDPFFRGRIKSKAKRCTRNRRVVVYRNRNRGRVTRFRSGRSDQRGFWRVIMAHRMRTGSYFAVAKPKPGCAKAKSRQIGVGQNGPDGLG